MKRLKIEEEEEEEKIERLYKKLPYVIIINLLEFKTYYDIKPDELDTHKFFGYFRLDRTRKLFLIFTSIYLHNYHIRTDYIHNFLLPIGTRNVVYLFGGEIKNVESLKQVKSLKIRDDTSENFFRNLQGINYKLERLNIADTDNLDFNFENYKQLFHLKLSKVGGIVTIPVFKQLKTLNLKTVTTEIFGSEDDDIDTTRFQHLESLSLYKTTLPKIEQYEMQELHSLSLKGVLISFTSIFNLPSNLNNLKFLKLEDLVFETIKGFDFYGKKLETLILINMKNFKDGFFQVTSLLKLKYLSMTNLYQLEGKHWKSFDNLEYLKIKDSEKFLNEFFEKQSFQSLKNLIIEDLPYVNGVGWKSSFENLLNLTIIGEQTLMEIINNIVSYKFSDEIFQKNLFKKLKYLKLSHINGTDWPLLISTDWPLLKKKNFKSITLNFLKGFKINFFETLTSQMDYIEIMLLEYDDINMYRKLISKKMTCNVAKFNFILPSKNLILDCSTLIIYNMKKIVKVSFSITGNLPPLMFGYIKKLFITNCDFNDFDLSNYYGIKNLYMESCSFSGTVFLVPLYLEGFSGSALRFITPTFFYSNEEAFNNCKRLRFRDIYSNMNQSLKQGDFGKFINFDMFSNAELIYIVDFGHTININSALNLANLKYLEIHAKELILGEDFRFAYLKNIQHLSLQFKIKHFKPPYYKFVDKQLKTLQLIDNINLTELFAQSNFDDLKLLLVNEIEDYLNIPYKNLSKKLLIYSTDMGGYYKKEDDDCLGYIEEAPLIHHYGYHDFDDYPDIWDVKL